MVARLHHLKVLSTATRVSPDRNSNLKGTKTSRHARATNSSNFLSSVGTLITGWTWVDDGNYKSTLGEVDKCHLTLTMALLINGYWGVLMKSYVSIESCPTIAGLLVLHFASI